LNFKEIHIDDYDGFFQEPSLLFLNGAFNKGNFSLAAFRCFVSTDKNDNIGVVGVVVDNVFLSPYMASYGGLRFGKQVSLSKILNFVSQLKDLLRNEGLYAMKFVLPPLCLGSSQVSVQYIAMQQMGFEVEQVELNHYFCLGKLTNDFSYLKKKDADNLRYSLNRGLNTKLVKTEDEKLEIYEMLKKSRDKRQIPLKMTFQKLQDLEQFVSVEYWTTKTTDDLLCAGAIVFVMSNEVAQVVYWGFDPDYSPLDAMKALSFDLFKSYKERGFELVDLGISSENSIVNLGLAAFKENIGCETSLRFTLKCILYPDASGQL
jgi:hypothetical protein